MKRFSWPDRAHATDGVRNPFLLRNSHNKRACLYKLTPRGLSEKAALALRFLRRKEQERQASDGPEPQKEALTCHNHS